MKHLHSEAWEGILKIISKQNKIKRQFSSTHQKVTCLSLEPLQPGFPQRVESVKHYQWVIICFHWLFRIDGSVSQDLKTDGRTSNSYFTAENSALFSAHACRAKKPNYQTATNDSSSSFFLVVNISWLLNLRKSEKCLSRLPRAHEGIFWFIQTVQHLFPVQISISSPNFQYL